MYSAKSVVRVPQIARLCGVSEESVRQWCRSQWLKSRKTRDTMEWVIYFEDLAEHFADTPRHLDKLLNAELERKNDLELRRCVLREIKAIRSEK